jgi:hypothetical protein
MVHRMISSLTESSVCGMLSAPAFTVFKIDNQFELGGLLDRHLSRFAALQDLIRMRGRLAV